MNEKELENRITILEERTKSNTHRVDKVEDMTKAIYQINANMESMFKEMKDIREDNVTSTQEIKTDIKDIRKDITDVRSDLEDVKDTYTTDKAVKWDKVSWLVVSGIITFVLGYMLNLVVK